MSKTPIEQEWTKWDEQMAVLEAKLSPKRKDLLSRISQDWVNLRQAFFELPGLQMSLQLSERLIQGHDPLKITLMNLARDLTELNIAFFRRLLLHSRNLVVLQLAGRRLAQHNVGREANATDIKSLALAAADLQAGHMQLQNRIAELENEIHALRNEYELFLIEENSHEAAYSFGPDRSPGERPWEGLSRLLKGIAIQTRQDPEHEKTLQKAQQIFQKRSENLLAECGELLGRDITTDHSRRFMTLKRMKKNLADIRRLEMEMEESLTVAATSEQTPSLLVKKISDQARTP